MKRVMSSMMASVVLSVLMLGCSVKPETAKIIAKSTGIGASVTWIAYDNPDSTAKSIVNDTLSMVQDNLALVTEGKTYTEVIYPIVVEFTKEGGVEERYVPLVLAGSMSILNGIDILFATNPEWKTKAEFASDISNEFINGAKIGLSLDNNDASIRQANEMHSSRAAIKKAYSVIE
jgi:hypothetical protein